MGQMPDVLIQHSQAATAALDYLESLGLTPQELDGQIRAAWQARAGDTPADPMEHYFQAFTFFLAKDAPDLAHRYAATLVDHDYAVGVPVLIARLYAIGATFPKGSDLGCPDGLKLLMQYLRILQRMTPTGSGPSKHEWLRFVAQVDIRAEPRLTENPDSWGAIFHQELISAQKDRAPSG
jgi:hypothetical protein